MIKADGSGIFDADSEACFRAAYPLQPARLSHAIANHPLFARGALDDAARRLGAALVEAHHTAGPGDALGGERPDLGPQAPRWSMLRFVDRLPEYRALLEQVVGELTPAIRARTGEPLDLRGFVFVSTPRTVTPLHFDPEHNILIHLAGRKRFWLLPAQPPWLPTTAHAALHVDGANMLAWRERWREDAACFDLVPGDALFVPYKSPHWIEVDDEPSVSLSVTWQCEWTRAQAALHRLSARAAEAGIALPQPPAWPRVPLVRLFAARVLGRVSR